MVKNMLCYECGEMRPIALIFILRSIHHIT